MIHPPVVLDTNVFVAAAFRPESDASRVVRSLRQGELRMVWSDSTRRETRSILQRIPPITWDPFASLFHSEHRFTTPAEEDCLARISDPSDRIFAASAKACGALLITRDRHLLTQRNALPIDILTPTELLASRSDDSFTCRRTRTARRARLPEPT